MTQPTAQGLVLRPLALRDEDQALSAQAELANEDHIFLPGLEPGEDWGHYVRKLSNQALGLDLPDGWVPARFFAAVVGEDLVGRVSIRLSLTEYLSQFGGNIGYMVRPQFRHRGYATEMLRQAVVLACEDGMERILVTCDDTDAASARVIERCGGLLESVVPQGQGAPAKRRYWIDVRY